MQIRLEGKESEMNDAISKIKDIFPVKSVSNFYRNRKSSGISEYGRVYINLESTDN